MFLRTYISVKSCTPRDQKGCNYSQRSVAALIREDFSLVKRLIIKTGDKNLRINKQLNLFCSLKLIMPELTFDYRTTKIRTKPDACY